MAQSTISISATASAEYPSIFHFKISTLPYTYYTGLFLICIKSTVFNYSRVNGKWVCTKRYSPHQMGIWGKPRKTILSRAILHNPIAISINQICNLSNSFTDMHYLGKHETNEGDWKSIIMRSVVLYIFTDMTIS